MLLPYCAFFHIFQIIKLIFDGVGLIMNEPMSRPELTEITLGIGKDKKTIPFIASRYVKKYVLAILF